jgi:hypothetical protein
VAFRRDFQGIPPHDDGARLLGLVKPKQHVGEADNCAGALTALARYKALDDGRMLEAAVTVDDLKTFNEPLHMVKR